VLSLVRDARIVIPVSARYVWLDGPCDVADCGPGARWAAAPRRVARARAVARCWSFVEIRRSRWALIGMCWIVCCTGLTVAVRTFRTILCESCDCSKLARAVEVTDREVGNTFDWERECSFPGFGISRCRALSMESENTRSRWLEWIECRVRSTENENARFLYRSIRMSSTLDGERERSLSATESVIESRVRSTAVENALVLGKLRTDH